MEEKAAPGGWSWLESHQIRPSRLHEHWDHRSVYKSIATGIYGLLKLCSCATYLIFFADSLGRRKSTLWTAIALACVMVYIGLYIPISPP